MLGGEQASTANGADPGPEWPTGPALDGERPAEEPGPTRLDQLRGALLNSAALDKLPAPVPLLDGLLMRNSLAWLHGKPGHYKSLLALDWSCCVAAGLPWLGRGVTAGPVLYVIAEGTSGLPARVRAWEDNAREQTSVLFLPVAVQLRTGDFADLAGLAAELGAALVVLDTQARVTLGQDENSAVDMGRLVAAADYVRAASGACVLFLHHEPRAGDNMRGSTALEGAADTTLRVTKDGPRIEVTNPKQKDSAEADPIRAWVVPRLHSVIIAAQPPVSGETRWTAGEAVIMATMRDSFETTGAAGTTLRDATGLTKPTFYRALNHLLKDGELQNLGSRARSFYALPQTPLPPASLT